MNRARWNLSSVLLVCLLTLAISTTASATAVLHSSLGWWDNGAAGSTHEYWDFTPSHVTSASNGGYTATPEELINPDPYNVLATVSPARSYDGQSGFISARYIAVNLELPNFSTKNPYKEIWVKLGTNTTINLEDITISAGPTDTAYEIQLVSGQNGADFGVKIWPNPGIEKIQFVLFPPTPTVAVFPVTLDYIQVDTICVPEPMTIGLLSIGGLFLRRRLA
jgi:hypothetical protein